MAEFLTQQEIDELLGIAGENDIAYPLFLYIKKPNGGYGILEVTKSFSEKLLGRTGFSEEDIYHSLEKLGNKIIICEQSKKRLTQKIHKRYNDLIDAENELKVLKKYLSDFPEYII